MELYIPPPSAFLPRLPPPRPVVPAVPVVPIPDLPETVHAPEGAYTLNPSLFPPIGTPAAPLPFDRPPPMPSASFIAGASGFMIAPPGPVNNIQAGQTAMSFGSTVVNGQTQPAWPVKMSWVNVYFPSKIPGDKSGLGGLLGMGGKGDPNATPGAGGAVPQMPGYEPSVSSDSDSPTSSDNPPPLAPIEVPLSALPQQGGKRLPFSKTTSVPSGLPRPKNNLRSSSSTFVTRLQALDGLPKILAERGRAGGEMVRWGFWNLGRTFGWGEEGGRVKEALARVTFSQVPTCHTVSHLTAGPDRVDILVGFASGDIVWLDFVVGRYTRINKGGLLNNNAVVSINFDPRHPNYFIAAFDDSTILQFNLFAEDPVPIIISANPMPWTAFFERQTELQEPATPSLDLTAVAKNHEKGQVFEDSMLTWKNEEFGNLGDIRKANKGEERSPWAGRNPMGAVKIGRKGLTAMSYSPDGRLLAVVSEDGLLRLIDVAEERLTDTFAGYFEGLTCVAWSPDSRFLAVGGKDDLITIFSPRESRVVARCQGHSAFVTAITFDHSRGGGYRFASVGEDGKLVLWDFTAAQLHRPRHHHPNTSHHRIPGSTLSLHKSHEPSAANGGFSTNPNVGKFHPAPPRSEVALLQPVMARMVEGNLLTSVHFTPSAIFTVSRAALVKIWQRPPKQTTTATRRQAKNATRIGDVLRSPRERDVAITA